MNSKLITLIALIGGLTATFLSAQSATEQEFIQLRAERDKQMAIAADPVNRRYKDGLDKLYRKAIQASDLTTAKAIQAELQVVGGAAAASNPGNPLIKPTAPAVNPADKAALKKFVEDSEWSAWKRNGPTGAPEGTFVFRKDGTITTSGESFRTIRNWDVAAPNTLTLYRVDPKKNRDAEKHVMRVNMADKTASRDGSVSTINGDLFLKYVGPAKKK